MDDWYHRRPARLPRLSPTVQRRHVAPVVRVTYALSRRSVAKDLFRKVRACQHGIGTSAAVTRSVAGTSATRSEGTPYASGSIST